LSKICPKIALFFGQFEQKRAKIRKNVFFLHFFAKKFA